MKKPTASTWLALLVLTVVTIVALLFGVWWWTAVVAFAYGLWRGQLAPGYRFWPAFLVGFVLWGAGALWFGGGAGTLPQSLAVLFGLGTAWALHLVIAMVGGLLLGVFAMLGAYTFAVVRPVHRVAQR